MNQEKIGKFIKELRKKNNMTQQQIADKYNVSFQAVSKWENGINMPDSSILKKISEDFNVSLEELYNGETKKNFKYKKNLFILCFVIFIVILNISLLIIINLKSNEFQFKTLNTTNNNFSLSGSISYNNDKSAIYITNIKYNGIDDTEKYNDIKCILYESSKNIERKISSYEYNDSPTINLSTFLTKITFAINDYESTFKYNKNVDLYLSINATNIDGITTIFTIPLETEDNVS